MAAEQRKLLEQLMGGESLVSMRYRLPSMICC